MRRAITSQPRNLAEQGFVLLAHEQRALRAGLRFSTGLCLALVVIATAARSAPAMAVLAGVGAVAGWSPRHPFDHLYNHGVARLTGAVRVPPTPVRRRHAFKVAAVWLAASAVALAAGATALALALLAVLAVLCAVQTATFLCVPSLVLALLDARRAQR